MTLTDMRCDRCNAVLSGPASPGSTDPRAGVRFGYHPGDPRMRDDSGVLCAACWDRWAEELGEPRPRECARCGMTVRRGRSLHLRRADVPATSWQLCATHAVEMLNQLRTVADKFDVATFRFPLDDGSLEEVAGDDGGSDD